MKRSYILLSSMVAAAAAMSSLTNCNGDTSNNTDGGDAGQTDAKPTKDVVQGGDGGDGAVTVVTPAGKQLYASDKVQIFGITTDGFIIFADNGTAGSAPLYAADATGATAPIKIATPAVTSTATYVAGIAGKVVFLWEGISTAKNAAQVGKLSLWTSTGTLKAATNLSSPTAGFASTTDGTKVLYSANSNTTATVGDIVGANVDATSPMTLLTGTDINGAAGATCPPVIGFAGGKLAVTATCATAPPDGGTPVATVTSYTAAWAPTTLLSNAINFWASDTAGDKVLVSDATSIQIFPINVGVGTPVDATKSVNHGFGYLKKDGNNAIYTTSSGDFWVSPVLTPVPVQLQASGVKFVRSISQDDNYIIYSTTLDSMQFGGDLYLSKTTASAAPTTLITGLLGALFGVTSADDFTADSKYALWIENLDSTHGIGDLYAQAVTAGTPTKITSAEWTNASATASKIVFNDNCQGCSGTAGTAGGTADLKSVDVSTTNTPTVLQATADVTFVLNNAKDHVIYGYSQNAPTTGGPPPAGGNGLYSVAIP